MARATASSAPTSSKRGGGLWLGLFLFVGFWIGRAVIVTDAGDELRESRPAVSLALGDDSAEVLASAAHQALIANHPAQAARYAYAGLDRSPLDVAAIRERALALRAVGQADAERCLMAFSGQLSWRDNPTQAWLLRDDIRQHRWRQMVIRLDSVLRRLEDLRPRLYPILIAAAPLPDVQQTLLERLALKPEWRSGFLQSLAVSRQKDAIVDGVFEGVGHGPAPLTVDELTLYLNRLAAEGRYRDARQALLALGRPEWSTATPFNGDFAPTQGAAPFDWRQLETSGVDLSFLPRPTGGGTALRVDYDGYSSTNLLRQVLVLRPGTYRLTGRALAESEGTAPLAWELRCAGGGAVLGRAGSPPEGAGVWRSFEASFDVPAQGCEGQWLTLVGTPGDRQTSNIVWFTGLRVTPAG